MAEFAKGINVKTIKTKFGEIVKLGINLEQFCEGNEVNESGFINVELKKSKAGDFYAVIPEAPKK